MQTLSQKITDLIVDGVRVAQDEGMLPSCELPSTVSINRPKKLKGVDFSSALPLQLAKRMNQGPLDIAHSIERCLPQKKFVGQTSVSPPGFVNISLAADWLAEQVNVILDAGKAFADLKLGCGYQAQVEFVSANPTGPLTVGHGRGGAIGDTMANLLKAVGYEVTREYYYNNAGEQMRKLGESLMNRYLQALGQDVEIPQGHYQGEYLVQIAQRLIAEHGNALASEGWERFRDIAEEDIFGQQRNTLAEMGITMDVFFNERSLYEDKSIWRILDELRERGYVYDRDGASWFAATQMGGDEDRVIVKSSGEPTYRLPDIAYHCNKLDRGFKLIVDVLGSDHKDAFPDVMRGVQAMGYDGSSIKLLMNQFVTVKGARMSKRAGLFTTLNDLVREVGTDVVRFFLLMRAADSHLEFDLDLALEQSDKNPVYYVQYAHARICSILRKADLEGFKVEGCDVKLLAHPSEMALIIKLLDLSEVIDISVRELAPHHLTTFARELASAFHSFYRDCRVIDANSLEITGARLHLVQAAKIGLSRTLNLLGVSAPDTM